MYYKMHILQPKHLKLNEKESQELLARLNISRSQIPKILLHDPTLPENCKVGDIIKVERKNSEEKSAFYYRVVV